MKIKGNEIKYLLVSSGLLDEETLKEAEAEAENAEKPLDEILLEKKYITERDLVRTYAKYINVPYIDLRDRIVPKNVLLKLPEKHAIKYQSVFFAEENGIFFLGMADPEDFQAVQFIEKQSGFRVKVFMAAPSDISYILDQYKEGLSTEIAKAVVESEEQVEEFKEEIEEDVTTDQLGAIVKEAPIAKALSILLEYAVKQRASDIHIEPRETGVMVRYRIDGVLRETMTLPKAIQSAIATRIKIISNLKIDEHRVPQDGRFKINIGKKTIALRVSTLPVIFGEKIVMRLLDESSKPLSLEELGFRGKALEIIKRNLSKTHGMVLVTGPTGSGKSTTLYSILNILNTPGVNISTVEDPIEYRIPGVNQTQANAKVGMTFAFGLRALLRQDPDIIMVGEIRDTETAEMAVHAALTGHVVLSTLHTNNAATTLPRMTDMDIESFLIASTVNTVIAQRLVRVLCQECREAYAPSEEILNQIHEGFNMTEEEKATVSKSQEAREPQEVHSGVRKIGSPSREILNNRSILEAIAEDPSILNRKAEEPNDNEEKRISKKEESKAEIKPSAFGKVTLFKPRGCSKCDNGYKGRMGIYEVLEIDSEIGDAIIARKSAEEIEALGVQKGMLTMQQDGFLKALEGTTTLEEVLRVTKE
ncbi:MAG: Type II secretion system protein E [candidate division CPR2 bacterium GW2011_GWC1_39_9]|uniref:Type II secretion system protein E n=1 Tax=candidate division CPR2 bacterium GW2011_GWC2_39_10 TaxID=1618345 RepID=A0A0G0LSP9_UNCC2|nr:MAG: Type II secretion system protein E [candidate division CPR2 bacterium GW2011_GWC2_39_10]KKR36007.1 MAG: Type II secretion system protein E [candidate division CPR2 bacterium GW2011_GWC1_39_9]